MLGARLSRFFLLWDVGKWFVNSARCINSPFRLRSKLWILAPQLRLGYIRRIFSPVFLVNSCSLDAPRRYYFRCFCKLWRNIICTERDVCSRSLSACLKSGSDWFSCNCDSILCVYCTKKLFAGFSTWCNSIVADFLERFLWSIISNYFANVCYEM